VDHRIATPYHP
jgi:hypothetical protein